MIINGIADDAFADERVSLVGSSSLCSDGFSKFPMMDFLVSVAFARDGADLNAIIRWQACPDVDQDRSAVNEVLTKPGYAPVHQRPTGKIHQDVDVCAKILDLFDEALTGKSLHA